MKNGIHKMIVVALALGLFASVPAFSSALRISIFRRRE